MKIDLRPIVHDHIATLRDDKTQGKSYPDLVLFYGLPVAFGIVSYYQEISLDREAFNASITFFGIFIALLLNVQVAIFSIYQRKWQSSSDNRVDEVRNEQVEKRRQLLGELNANVSYLILICFVSLVISLTAYALKADGNLVSAFILVAYAHFLLTMMMIVKRSHILFQKEYGA